ncbi:hypothetical protein CSA57_14040 [candidate division KSB3 bacterium]|nr:MAG: hypothetical protein CSA57_14040 [candidate division KSB3 bacterium]
MKFSATLGSTERIISYVVAIGVGIGLPLFLGTLFYFIFATPLSLLLAIPFFISILIAYLYAPKEYLIANEKMHIYRKIGQTTGLPIDQIEKIHFPATTPPGFTAGLLSVAGVFGTFGISWNKSWGVYKEYVTNHVNRVELITKIGLKPLEGNEKHDAKPVSS